MEEEKRKKKNKKKKSKQNKGTEDSASASSVGETSSQDVNHQSSAMETDINGAHDIATDRDSHHTNNDNSLNGQAAPDGDERQNWLVEKARLKEMVKQLLHEKDSHIQRQFLHPTGDQPCLQAGLDKEIIQLRTEKDFWYQKEVSLEQKLDQLLQEKASLALEERNLREKVKDLEKETSLYVEKENSSREVIAGLNDDNTRLRLQVVELEESKIDLLQENQRLTDSIIMLQSRVQDLERSLPSTQNSADVQKDASRIQELSSEVEAACTLVEKLITENADLVEKLNELYMELGRRDIPERTISIDPEPASEFSGSVGISAGSGKSLDSISLEDKQGTSDDVDSDYATMIRNSSDTTVSGEIVQIPLDEFETRDLEAHGGVGEGDEPVPLTDSPLIGAPFRLVSFVANYVSGADLVNSSTYNSVK